MSYLPYFPNWKTAEIDIERILNEFFNVGLDKDVNEVKVSFLPEKVVYSIPEEDREVFNAIYEETISYILFETKLADVMNKFIGEPISDELLVRIRHEIMRVLKEFEWKINVDVLWILKGAMGIPKYKFYVPAPLKARIENRMKRIMERRKNIERTKQPDYIDEEMEYLFNGAVLMNAASDNPDNKEWINRAKLLLQTMYNKLKGDVNEKKMDSRRDTMLYPTPGPWRVQIDTHWSVYSEKGLYIGNATRFDNAVLIACAPELLESCEAALEHLESLKRNGIKVNSKVIGSLKSIIEKAKGEETET